ncbi:MAG TPA: hypothetical protein PKH29_12040, partial [Oscillospiraceae bacterium]|nr:hypothetical protein [Oscillospiraceae bacterium]
MDVKLDMLIAYEKFLQAPIDVLDIVDKYGQAIILKNNAPFYIIIKPQVATANNSASDDLIRRTPMLTLQEAMKTVLLDAKDHQMHAAELADKIYDRGLYVQKNGEKAKYNQMRARCGHYPEMFEALKGNVIRLRTK